jgi:hypothetical protein
MAITAYITALQNLLHDVAAQFYPVSTLTGFINEARQQIALEGECIRGVGSLTLTPLQTLYQNTSVTSPASPLGISALATPRSISWATGFGANGSNPVAVLEKRAWPWFQFYILGIQAPVPGRPATWAPFDQGTPALPQGGSSGGPIGNGSFYINPPNQAYVVNVEGSWSPINLALDTDPEAIPSPWTDAVPHYAMYLAMVDARAFKEAEEAFQAYETMVGRARGIVTPLEEQQAYPGGLMSRRFEGQAPPTRGMVGTAVPAPGRGRAPQ